MKKKGLCFYLLMVTPLFVLCGCSTSEYSSLEDDPTYKAGFEAGYNKGLEETGYEYFDTGYSEGYSAGFSNGSDESYIYETDIYNRGVLTGLEYAIECISFEKLSDPEKEALDEYFNEYHDYVYGTHDDADEKLPGLPPNAQ